MCLRERDIVGEAIITLGLPRCVRERNGLYGGNVYLMASDYTRSPVATQMQESHTRLCTCLTAHYFQEVSGRVRLNVTGHQAPQRLASQRKRVGGDSQPGLRLAANQNQDCELRSIGTLACADVSVVWRCSRGNTITSASTR